jgi:hypothetical protein
MGLNTTLVLMNDYLHNIQEDKNLGDKIWNAVTDRMINIPRSISCGGAVEAIKVIETHHSSIYYPVLVGGNTGELVTSPVALNSENLKLALLKSLANELGYRVSKKPIKK